VKKGKELTRNNVTKKTRKIKIKITSKENNKRVTSKQQERL
jgi:hypothetical protein